MTRNTVLVAVRTALATLVLTGLLYPLAVTGVARLLFPDQAGGGLVRDEQGRVIGSRWIGQAFASAAYFQPRPSAGGHDATASGGSNLGPTSEALRARAAAEVARLSREDPGAGLPVPAHLVTASASGLDPHVSPEAALWQVQRVAAARDVAPARVRAVVESHTEGRTLGILGEPRVNVLLLNLAIDRKFGRPPTWAPAASGR